LHLGTEDQAPDPVIEMHECAGNVPAYRGLAYITFDELPLKDFGNRIPNITAEIVATASTVHPSQQLDLTSQGVDNWGQNGWLIDPERPFVNNCGAAGCSRSTGSPASSSTGSILQASPSSSPGGTSRAGKAGRTPTPTRSTPSRATCFSP
jgi:hypothetical protein